MLEKLRKVRYGRPSIDGAVLVRDLFFHLWPGRCNLEFYVRKGFFVKPFRWIAELGFSYVLD